MSSVTRICPSHCGDAPMPIVGASTARVISSARSAATPSTTIAKAPADRSRALRDHALPLRVERPLALKPPSTLVACGRRPTCRRPGCHAPTRNETVCAIPSPDSTLTAWHPVSRISVTADSCACCGLRSYDPKGKIDDHQRAREHA